MLYIYLASRILAISEAASVYPKITFAACIVHWFIMTMWLSIYERTWFCRSSTSSSKSKNNVKNSLEISFCAVLGLVYIFAFLTTNDGHTRFKYIFYYSVCFVENTVAILLWSVWGKPESTEFWWFVPLLVITFIMFILGIILMLLYYIFCHPKIGLISKSKYESSHSVEKLDDLNEDEDEDEDRMSEEVQTND